MASSSSSTSKTSSQASDLYLRTPLIKSDPLSQLCQRDVYLKLDCLQPSGSFKDRGMAQLATTLRQRGVSKLIASSGGNAGLAVATVGAKLQMQVQVIVPQSTKPHVIAKLQQLGADVQVHGKIWNEADLLARELVANDEHAEYVSPYDDPLLWQGHSSIVKEVLEDLPTTSTMIVSVGGGGLLCGVLEGLQQFSSSSKMKVVACETEGAASFGKSWHSGTKVRLDTISSLATSLGALEVTDVAIQRSHAHSGQVMAQICTDREAVDACLQLAEDHRLLVEPACGAGLAALYSDRLRKETLKDTTGPVVVEVCGGSGVNLELLAMWKQELGI